MDVARANFQEVLEAVQDRRPANELGHLERQERTVARSLERCPRCGDHVATFFPNHMTVLCSACLAKVRESDPEKAWFADMVADHNQLAKRRAKQGE